MAQSSQLFHGVSCHWQTRLICRDIEGEYATIGTIFLWKELAISPIAESDEPTRFVPLLRTQMLVSTSTRSPKVYGKGGPFDIAEATADLKNSMGHKKMERQNEEVGGL